MPLAHLTDPVGRVRLGRYSSAGEVALIELRAYGSRRPFVDLSAGRAVAQALGRAERLAYGRSLAWVLLPDRLLWLAQLLPDGMSLARLVGSVKGRSTWLIGSRRPELGGRIWAQGYDDEPITTRSSLIDALRSIVAAPAAAGLVSNAADYPYWDAAWLPVASDPPQGCSTASGRTETSAAARRSST